MIGVWTILRPFLLLLMINYAALAQHSDKQQLLEKTLKETAEATRKFLRRQIVSPNNIPQLATEDLNEHDMLLNIIADTLNTETANLTVEEESTPDVQKENTMENISNTPDDKKYYAKDMICHVHDNKLKCSSLNIDDIVFENSECLKDSKNQISCERNLLLPT